MYFSHEFISPLATVVHGTTGTVDYVGGIATLRTVMVSVLARAKESGCCAPTTQRHWGGPRRDCASLRIVGGVAAATSVVTGNIVACFNAKYSVSRDVSVQNICSYTKYSVSKDISFKKHSVSTDISVQIFTQ
jgi:hypothetical protein